MLTGTRYITGANSERAAKDKIDELSAATRREPGPYTLLAYEAARLVGGAAKNIAPTNLPRTLPGALRIAEFEDPHGTVKFSGSPGVLLLPKADHDGQRNC